MRDRKNALGEFLIAIGENLTHKQPVRDRFKHAGVIVSVMGLIAGLVTYLFTYNQNITRDKTAATLRMCEAFETDGVVNAALDNVTRLNRRLDPVTNEVKGKPIIKSNFPDPYIQDRVQVFSYRWLNFMDVIAIGMDAGVYDSTLIEKCLGRVFRGTLPDLLRKSDDPQMIVKLDDFPRVAYWACRFTKEEDRKKAWQCAIVDPKDSKP